MYCGVYFWNNACLGLDKCTLRLYGSTTQESKNGQGQKGGQQSKELMIRAVFEIMSTCISTCFDMFRHVSTPIAPLRRASKQFKRPQEPYSSPA